MFKITYIWDDNNLGASISAQDDIFAAMREGEQKAIEIATALRQKIKTVRPDDIEIQVRSYSPQLSLEGFGTGGKRSWKLPSEAIDKMDRKPKQKTLKTLGA